MPAQQAGETPALPTLGIAARIRDALPRGRALPPEDFARRHKVIIAIVWAHAVALACFALYRGNPLGHSLFEGGIVATFAAAAMVATPHSRRVAATITALGLLTASAVLVHLSHGTIEAHFHFFVMVTVLVLYEDWVPFLAAIAYVVLQHGVAGAIDPSSVFNHVGAQRNPWRWAGIHGFFIICLSAANIASWRLNEIVRAQMRRALARMRFSEERSRSAFEMAPIGMALTSPQGIFMSVNRSLLELTGYTEDQLLGRSFADITHPDERAEGLAAAKRLLADELDTYHTEKRYLTADGGEVWVELAVTLQRDEQGEPVQFISQMLDLTQRKRAEAQLAHQALHDPLTELPNHTHFHELVETAVARSSESGAPVAVVSVGLGSFKAINDLHGHPFGDEVLRLVGRALRLTAPADAVVARVGGDEFALLLPGADGETAKACADRARQAVARASSQGVDLSAAAGVAIHPDDTDDAARLVHLAEATMYQVKREGGNGALRYDSERVKFAMSVAEQRLEIEEVLNREGAMRTVFQPLVALATGEVVGYEALARFELGPPRGPDAWFAQAHRCGLGPELEARALELAMATPGRPEGTHLSLNLSPSALVSEQVFQVLPADCSELVFEITEHELATEERALVSALDELRSRGGLIAVDDAGAGYAGLQQVMRLHPDIIKLDRALTDGVSSDAAKVALIESFVRFASRTGALVCAEGVETIDDLRVLADLDVAWGQGYGLARPTEPWAEVVPEAVAACTEGLVDALRAGAALGSAGDVRLERVTSGLAGVTSLGDLTGLTAMVAAELGADKVSFSVYEEAGDYVQTVGSEDWREDGERFMLDDYPTTRHVLDAGEAVQILARDPHADRNETALLHEGGFESLMMLPMVFHGRPLGLLEAYSRDQRSWTRAQINRGRIICNQFAAVLDSFVDAV